MAKEQNKALKNEKQTKGNTLKFSFYSILVAYTGSIFFLLNTVFGYGDLYFSQLIGGSIIAGVHILVGIIVVGVILFLWFAMTAGAYQGGSDYREGLFVSIIWGIFLIWSSAMFFIRFFVMNEFVIFLQTVADIGTLTFGILLGLINNAAEQKMLRDASNQITQQEYERSFAAKQKQIEEEKREREEAYAQLQKANAELAKQNAEFERLNKLLVGRELAAAKAGGGE